jgi:hypothetical protein
LLIFLASVVASHSTFAQQTLGSINGTVTDSSGASVANASVFIVDDQTSATRSVISSASGAYSFKDLAVGTYSFTVSATGFSTEKIASGMPDVMHQ